MSAVNRRRLYLLSALAIWISGAGLMSAVGQPIIPVVRKGADKNAESPATAPAESTEPEEATSEPADATTEPAETPTTASAPAEQPELKPRIELYVPSTAKLLSEAKRSHAATIADAVAGLLGGGSQDENATGFSDVKALAEQILDWPDTSIIGALYAPDVEGRPRFALRFDYDVDKFKDRLEKVITAEAAQNAFKGLVIEPRKGGGYTIELTDLVMTAGHLIGDAEHCWFVSHEDMELPERVWGQPAGKTAREPRLLYCRYNLAGTEKDSGSVFGNITAIQSLNYWCQVGDDGDWEEQFATVMPGGSAAFIQGIFSPMEKHFRVPSDALASLVLGFSWEMIIDSMVRLPPGTLEFSAKKETCIAVLPGAGFLPVPDVVIQSRIRKADDFLKSLDAAAKKINDKRKRDDQEPVWFEEDVNGKKAYWRQASGGSIYTPFVFRHVLFVQETKDAEGQDQHLMILGMTSTDPRRFVERWCASRPADEFNSVPTEEKLDAQGFIHWKAIYKLAAPYINMAASLSPDAKFLPAAEDIQAHLVDSQVDVQLVVPGEDDPMSKPSFLKTRHLGPVPMGILYLPTVVGIASAPSHMGDTDLARERVAVRNLRVLYKNCKLFKKDYGRWPAEMWELDGYVDFAGNPQLLHLPKSMKGRFSEWFGIDVLEGEHEAHEEKKDDDFYDEDDDRPDLSLYVIHWSEDHWTLGYRKNALDHLDALYIDQDGKIHRVAKKDNGKKKEETEADGDDETKVSALDERTTNYRFCVWF